MSRGGRFGRYGEIKRIGRLRRSGFLFDPAARPRSLKERIRFGRKEGNGPQMRVRPVRQSDLHFVEELSGRVFEIYGPYRQWVSRWFKSDSAVTLIALHEERPVGFAMLGRFSNPSEVLLAAELLAIAVEPRKQRMGAGRLLMNEIEEIALSLGVNRLFLHTAKDNLPAQKLFRSCLFTPSELKRNFYPAGQDGLLMFKDLLL
ncbi:MAG: GNAT family N-acetyltransferase [Desulfobacterales bacterium]|nr:GNAT family N-acetyltransferase [Desulfobacterales bacterium]